MAITNNEFNTLFIYLSGKTPKVRNFWWTKSWNRRFIFSLHYRMSMYTTIMEQSPDCLIAHQATLCLEAELQELEDSYAECLGDNADAKTLNILWLRIKAIKRQIALV